MKSFEVVDIDNMSQEQLDHLKAFTKNVVAPKLYSLGEIFDTIEIGMLAVSVKGADEGLCIATDEKGTLFCFHDEPNEDGLIEVNYGFSFYLSETTPLRRYLLFKKFDEFYNFQSVYETDME